MNKKSTLQTVEMLSDITLNENLKKHYGTSVNEYMSREHSKEVLQEINLLRGLFEKYGKNKTSTLSLNEIQDFLSKLNQTQKQIDQDEVIKILTLMKKDPNVDLTVSEFIEDYIFLEEKLKIDNKKYEKALDELTLQINKCQESLKNAQDEIEISDGLTNKSSLFITVIEARDLIFENLNLIGDSKISVLLSFQGEEQETNTIEGGNANLSWCENFKFKVTEPNGLLRVEILEQSNLVGKRSLGFVSIDLNDLKDQKKKMNWYDLINEKNTSCGSIYLKLNCILNFRHFYQGEIELAENQIRIFQNALNITDYFVDNMNTPFGLLFSDNLEFNK
jgi:hypothetical protein